MSSHKQIKVIIAGGGTGGHIFPAVAIANELVRCNAATNILFVGALGKMEMEKVPKEGYKIIGLPIAGFNRSNLLKNITLPFKLIKSLAKAKSILKDFKPNIVIGVGGYASFPMLYMAQLMGIPTLIQEQNSYAGKSNIRLAKRANCICTGYPNMQHFFPASKTVYTGNPVRAVIANSTITKQEASPSFNLDSNKPTLLILGGSLGAKSVNTALLNIVDDISALGWQILWQTGKLSFAYITNAIKGKEATIKVHEFIYDMPSAYATADIIVSRAGALSIAELSIVGKPVVFVPYPFAAEDHQTVNAKTLVDKQAAICINDADVNSKLLSTLTQLMGNKDMQLNMAKQIKSFAITNAHQKIVNEIYKTIA
jgi:UDP-N-acetylglucosamine--N-acetylmuramyl-(pentapeptide) pyrophosphoryl-undecaprenol N-acetylglucosamine transferase